MNNQVIPYSLTVQVVCTDATKSRWYLPDDDKLRTRNIIGFAFRRQNTGGDRQTITGNDLVPDTVLGVSFLSLQSDGVNFLDTFPIDFAAINPDSENVVNKYIPLDLPNGFNPTKSFIDIADLTNLVTNAAFEITFIYQA